ncbi:MAG: hypothetical protein COA78_10880 [Blastopirellula sp.]|nr:MAG: hypothetical protein COA78_10880 [Blastopirellula sp.]
MLNFEGGGEVPVQYDVDFGDSEYYVRYRDGWLEVYANVVDFSDEELRLEVRVGVPYDGSWNARETNVYLSLLSRAIESGVFNATVFPRKVDIRKHDLYVLGPYPLYPVGLTCGFQEPSHPHEGRINRHDRRRRKLRDIHDHDNSCYAYISAHDVVAWVSKHPMEHQALKNVSPRMWEYVACDMELQL